MLYPSLYVFICLSVFLFVSLSLSVSVSITVCMVVCLSLSCENSGRKWFRFMLALQQSIGDALCMPAQVV